MYILVKYALQVVNCGVYERKSRTWCSAGEDNGMRYFDRGRRHFRSAPQSMETSLVQWREKASRVCTSCVRFERLLRANFLVEGMIRNWQHLQYIWLLCTAMRPLTIVSHWLQNWIHTIMDQYVIVSVYIYICNAIQIRVWIVLVWTSWRPNFAEQNV